MADFNFDELEIIEDVANELGCELEFLQFILGHPSKFYFPFPVPRKRRSEPRIVYEVDDDLKNIHKNILVAIAKKVDFPEYVQGFVFKRSIVTNASLHLGQKYILNLDIKNFFDSITIEEVICVFKSLGCNHEVALILARLCTLNDCLVQGANTSPILANLACIGLDQDLYQIALENSCSYSRYADDITFSGEKTPKTRAIARCLEKYGFQLNPEKWKCQRRGNIQYVTGLTVFDDTMPRLPKKVKRDLRQSLYYAEKYGLASHLEKLGMQDNMQEYINRIDGLIAFMYSVELECAYKFDTIWQEIRLKTNIPRSRHPSKILDKYRLRENLECSKST